MALRPLDEVRKALVGAWDLTRAGFWWRTAEAAADAGDWTTATQRLLHLADPLDDVPTGAPAWRQLAVASLDTAVRAGEGDLVTAACAQVLGRAWAPDDRLEALAGVFHTAQSIDAGAAALVLARIVRQRYASSAWAHYALGHFAEVVGWRAGASDPGRIVASFDRAAELFAEQGQTGRAHHAALRAAVARVVFGNQPDQGRAALRELSADTPDAEEYWLAHGRLHSSFWLDRVRAADWVVDAFAAAGRGAAASRRARHARLIALELMQNLPVRLSDPEHDRIRAVAAELDDELRWGIEAQLRGRAAAQEIADQPLTAVDEATARQLQSDALPLDGFTALVEAWHGRAPVVPPSRPVVAAVVDALLAEPASVGDALRALTTQVREARDARTLRPVLLVLVRVAALDDDSLRAPIIELVLHYANRAPAPTCGFLRVAQTMFDAGHHRAGAALMHRALEDGERGDGYETGLARAISWAARDGTDREMLAWLELGERELS